MRRKKEPSIPVYTIIAVVLIFAVLAAGYINNEREKEIIPSVPTCNLFINQMKDTTAFDTATGRLMVDFSEYNSVGKEGRCDISVMLLPATQNQVYNITPSIVNPLVQNLPTGTYTIFAATINGNRLDKYLFTIEQGKEVRLKITNKGITLALIPEPAPTPTPSAPGFEVVLAITGLLVTAFLVLKQRHD